MKATIKYILVLAVCMLTACQDSILSQKSPSTFDSQMVFSNYELAQSAFDGIWETLLDGQCYCLRYSVFTERIQILKSTSVQMRLIRAFSAIRQVLHTHA